MKLSRTQMAVAVGIILGQLVLIGLALFSKVLDPLPLAVLAAMGGLPIAVMAASNDEKDGCAGRKDR